MSHQFLLAAITHTQHRIAALTAALSICMTDAERASVMQQIASQQALLAGYVAQLQRLLN